ncbi:MAG TPA: Crp/Fnr family transcriptional regulator [Magnetospirillum sp.]|jgi:CRP-like cAMP-binding protein|nr:Crp/Fnr family transcriptional regulator [Magnetospirillum sp.]
MDDQACCASLDASAINCHTCDIVPPADWAQVPDSVVRTLNARKIVRTVPKGTVLFHEGDSVTTLFRLLSGVVLLRKGDHDGNSVVTRMVTPNATLGFRAFAARDGHSVSAHCATECLVCCIPADTAEMAFASNRALERAFAVHVAQELAYAEDAVLAQMRLSVSERLLLLLGQMAECFGTRQPDGTLLVQMPILRSDIAAMAGIARETFSRVIRKIEADGLLTFHGSKVHIPDADAFARTIKAIRSGAHT